MSTVERHLGKRYGFSCQPWLAVDIADRFFGSVYRTWFSTSLNPQMNGSSSNPLILFQELDRIVQLNDHNHSTVEQLRIRLSGWITNSGLPAADVAALLREIVSAPVPAFRPQLWKIDLRSIHVSRLVSLGQFPDEYQVSKPHPQRNRVDCSVTDTIVYKNAILLFALIGLRALAEYDPAEYSRLSDTSKFELEDEFWLCFRI